MIPVVDDLGWETPADPSNPYELPETPEQREKRKPLGHVQRIQILRRELGLSDAQYKAGLKRYGVESSKDLTPVQAAEVIERLTEALANKKAQQ